MKGKIIYTSWGYDMTHNDYAIITEATDKTVKCKMLKHETKSETMQGTGTSMPTLKETDQKPFRLRIKQYKNGEIYFKGSYPFCNDNKRMDTFSLWNGKANYWNTND
jgi:hypothetical protein